MAESEKKGSKRRIDWKLVNEGQNYDSFYPIFQQLSSTIFVRFKFSARFFVHEKYFGDARNRARKHDKIFFVISNPDFNLFLNLKKKIFQSY